MPVFKYKAASAEGEVLEGQMEAASQDAVIRRLQAQGHVPIRAEELGAQAPSGGLSIGRRAGRRAPTAQDVQTFTTELSTLLQAGLPLDRALELLESLAGGGAMSGVLSEVYTKVRGGADLSAALAEHPKLFSSFYVNMVRAGEAGGSMEVALSRLADFLERSRALRDAVVSALIYPAILLTVSLLSLTLIMGVVVPRISQMFESAGEQLPWYTQVVVTSGTFVQQYWWAFGLVAVGAVLWFRHERSTPAGRARFDSTALRLPIAGDLVFKIEAARFTRSLGTMLGNGVPLLDAVAIGRAIVSNSVLARGVERVAASIRSGEGLAGPILREGVLPDMAVKLVRVGEESGHLEEMLIKVAEIYEREVDTAVKRMVAVLAPALVLCLAALILGIMVSLIVPIITLNRLAF